VTKVCSIHRFLLALVKVDYAEARAHLITPLDTIRIPDVDSTPIIAELLIDNTGHVER
jgi:hypothetical protein